MRTMRLRPFDPFVPIETTDASALGGLVSPYSIFPRKNSSASGSSVVEWIVSFIDQKLDCTPYPA
jgi:hypothetical protein